MAHYHLINLTRRKVGLVGSKSAKPQRDRLHNLVTTLFHITRVPQLTVPNTHSVSRDFSPRNVPGDISEILMLCR